jgi:hypothetical protein
MALSLISTETDICNQALSRIGHEKISDVENPTTKAGRQCQLNYANIRDNMFSEYTWNFTIKRDRLTAAGLLDNSSNIISFVVNAGADTITDDGSRFLTGEFSDGDKIYITGSGSNNTTYDIDTAAAGTLTLETHESVTAEVLTNDSDLKLYAVPAGDVYSYKYALPADAIKMITVNDMGLTSKPPVWEVEGGYIVTNEKDTNDQIDIKYVQRISDVTKFPSAFNRVLYLKLAAQICMPLTNDRGLYKDILLELEDALEKAKFIMATEDNPETDVADDNFKWLNGRGGVEAETPVIRT